MWGLLFSGLLLCPTALVQGKLVKLPKDCPAPVEGALYSVEYHKAVVDQVKADKAELALRSTLLADAREALNGSTSALARAKEGRKECEANAQTQERLLATLADRPESRWTWAGVGAGGAVLGAVVCLFIPTTDAQEVGCVVLGGALGVLTGWLAD